MFLVRDVRETRVWQEGYEEGYEEGYRIGLQMAIDEISKDEQRNWKFHAIAKLSVLHISAADIADILGLDLDLVFETMGKKG